MTHLRLMKFVFCEQKKKKKLIILNPIFFLNHDAHYDFRFHLMGKKLRDKTYIYNALHEEVISC